MMNRRGFMASILAAGAAPFVARAGSLMAIRVPEQGIIVAEEPLTASEIVRRQGLFGESIISHPEFVGAF